MMKSIAKSALRGLVRFLSNLPGGRYTLSLLIEAGMGAKVSALHHGLSMTFYTPNALCDFRAATFSTKEPETLEWIESMSEGATFWDIGANIGLYSIYAAKQRGAAVFAFEPSVFNLEQLARNIYINALQSQVVIVPLALSEEAGASLFKMTTMSWGGALSTFGKDYGQHGELLNEVFEYKTCGMSMDSVSNHLNIPSPQYIKIDVDGIEHLILRGGASVLRGAKSVLIEIDDGFLAQADESTRHLKEAGLKLYRKCSLDAGRQYNQWWVREEPASS